MAVIARTKKPMALAALLILSLGPGARAETPDYKPTASEAVLLPKFCWHQFMGDKFSGPGYYIPPESCGWVTNHYCPGLVDLNRANRAIGDERKRRLDLLRARENTLYTLKGIKDFPHCPIRVHAETTLRIIDDQLKMVR